MEDLVKDLYGTYGRYINQFRAFPSILDGAKLVERRILYSMYEVAREKFTKSAKVVGFALGNYHPHGDQSVYQSLVGLVNNGMVDGQGNFGINVGVKEEPPAAMRYTEVKLSKDIEKLAFEFISYVPFANIELETEPVCLSTMLPLCFLGTHDYCQGLGFGYATKIPIYKKEDLIARLKWLLTKTGKEPIIKPITDCKYQATDADFQQLLTTGKAQIKLKGVYKIEGDHVAVYAIPPSRTFANIFKKFQEKIEDEKSLGWQDESRTSTCVRFKILRPRTYSTHDFVKDLDACLDGSVSYECNFCDEKGKVKLLSIDHMLVFVYKLYKSIVTNVFKTYIKDNQNKINELQLIEKIKPLLRDRLNTDPDDIDGAIAYISQFLGVNIEEIKKIFSTYTIGRLFKVKTDITKHQQEIQTLNNHLTNMDTYLWAEKYSKI